MITKESLIGGNFSLDEADRFIEKKMKVMLNMSVDYEWLVDFLDSLLLIYKKHGKTKNIINVERELGINIS